ncbi:hypothetical protein [Leptospira wolbachii]|uniref:hypothetical protein n=1 Tax=Leptospira wolbachii TaxID=29511 RepID=UPI0002EC346D|nr:hypothetical protein [Leptospira wolbachii]
MLLKNQSAAYHSGFLCFSLYVSSLTAKIGAAIISTVLTGGADQTDSSGYAGFKEINQTAEMIEETRWSSIPIQ